MSVSVLSYLTFSFQQEIRAWSSLTKQELKQEVTPFQDRRAEANNQNRKRQKRIRGTEPVAPEQSRSLNIWTEGQLVQEVNRWLTGVTPRATLKRSSQDHFVRSSVRTTFATRDIFLILRNPLFLSTFLLGLYFVRDLAFYSSSN